MNLVPCPCVDGTDGSWDGTDIQSDACPCCEGRSLVALEHVPSDFLYHFRDAPGIAREMFSRGFVCWVLEDGKRVPGRLSDLDNCELIGWCLYEAEAAE